VERGLTRYVVTARRPGGWIEQRTYIVYTQASGCIEDVKNSWLLAIKYVHIIT
jgi:hypothetical protein